MFKAIMQEHVAQDCQSMKPQPQVVTVVLNYNNFPDTIETLESACALKYKKNSLLLIENSTTKEIVGKIRSEFPALEIIENQKNLGYAGGNNVGLRYALEQGADYIFLLNNDVTLEPDVLDKLIAAMQSDQACAACQPLVTYYDGKDKVWSAGSELYFGYPRLFQNGNAVLKNGTQEPPLGLVGCALLFRTDALKEIGLFDESLFLLQEETDWCIRAVKLGFHLLVVSDAVAHHKVSRTLRSFSKTYLYYIGRNWILVSRKHWGRSFYAYVLFTELTTRIPYYLYRLAERGQIEMIKFYFFGLIDGLRGISGEKVF